MRQRYPYGSTNANNGLTLPDGRVSIDTERKAIRLRDGETPGGYEAVELQ